MNALKFVGMSEGAKKRKARALFVKQVFADTGTVTTSADEGTRWFHLWCLSSKEVASMDPAYFDLRAEYRVGERLAPCRYCRGPALYERCKGQRIAQDVVGDHIRGGCPFCMTCLDRRPFARFIPEDACNGSGVIPAKRAKR